MNDVVLMCGYPSSGKSTISKEYVEKGYVFLNRDRAGGKVVSLLPALEQALFAKRNVVIDNTFPTIESRKPFVETCKKADVPIRCLQMNTSIEDSQINALHRMWERHKKFFFAPNDLKGVDDPNMFPVAALFRYRKELQSPSKTEGFSSVEKIKFVRRPTPHKNKALILDYDNTLRTGTGEFGYPCNPSEVQILPGRTEKLNEYKDAGYILLGISNQSGIDKGNLDYQTAVACFERTNELLGFKIDFQFCPHQANPPTCYCRKPQVGLGVLLIEKHQLDPAQCVYVGDQTTDKTFAQRLGFKYIPENQFFKP